MEVLVGNGYTNPRWFYDRVNSFFNDARWLPETERDRRPLTDVVEDSDGYHFYFEMPGIKASYRDGVLEVAVAKKPEAKPTRIKVNVEN